MLHFLDEFKNMNTERRQMEVTIANMRAKIQSQEQELAGVRASNSRRA